MRRLRFLFIVQGEGRGHMSQALALSHILRSAGHRVVGVLVGSSARHEPPSYFARQIGAPVELMRSPHFAADDHERAIRLSRTLLRAARGGGEYRASIGSIGAAVRRHRPHLIVNFYEPLAGIYAKTHRPAAPMVCVGHQYLVHHPRFHAPERAGASHFAFKLFTEATAMGSGMRLALSFYPEASLPARRTVVMPPLLRAEVAAQRRARENSRLQPCLHEPSEQPFLLAYILNSGYAEEIIRWHRTRPETVVHCFWDDPTRPEVYRPAANLAFHPLDDEKFLWMLGRCKGLACTAGFESVCEAMYLGKPVMVVPVEGHHEQACNALDAVAAGAGMAADAFDLDAFVDFTSGTWAAPDGFSEWADSAGDVFLRHLESAAGRQPVRSAPAWTASRRARPPATVEDR